MQKNKIVSSIFILFILIIFSCTFFAFAQDQNSNQNIFLDSDQDGLSDEEEKTLGTNPANPDTDGDSYSDGVEVSSGYDPLKPAPGDKIIPEIISPSIDTTATSLNKTNLTKEIAEKASAFSDSENGDFSLVDIQDLVEEVIDGNLSQDSLPEITDEEIKIKKQAYSKYSEKKAFEKKKADFEEYAVATLYIFSSNSPMPITSSDDMSAFIKSFLKNLLSSSTSNNFSSFENFKESGEKILEQLKEVEVPEEIVETHKKGLQFAKHSIVLQKSIKPNPADPISELINMSKLQGLLESFSEFFGEIQEKLEYYDLDNDEFNEKLESLGIDVFEIDEQKIVKEIEKIN